MGFLGVAGWFKEGAGVLGVRAQEGNRRDSRAGIAASRCVAGRGGEDEPGSWARFVSGAPGALGYRGELGRSVESGGAHWASARGGKLGRAGGAGRGVREKEGKGWAASV